MIGGDRIYEIDYLVKVPIPAYLDRRLNVEEDVSVSAIPLAVANDGLGCLSSPTSGDRRKAWIS